MPENPNTSIGPAQPKVIARDVLQALKRKFPIVSSFATGFADRVLKKGQTAQVKITKELVAQTFDQSAGYVNQGLDYDLVDVEITEHKHVSIATDETERLVYGTETYQENIDNAAHALGKDLTDHMLGLVTAANFPNEFVKTAANSDYTLLTTARGHLRDLKAPTSGRFGIMAGNVFDVFADDDRVVSRDYRPVNPDYVDGSLMNIKGFEKVMEYPDLPSAENLLGIYGSRRGLVFATTIPTDPREAFAGLGNNGGIIEDVIDPEQGLRLMYRYWYNWANGDLQMDLVWLYGGKPLDPNCIVRQVSAATS